MSPVHGRTEAEKEVGTDAGGEGVFASLLLGSSTNSSIIYEESQVQGYFP